MLLTLATLTASATPCEAPVTPESWRGQLGQAELQLSGANLRGGQATARSAAQRATCLDHVPTPEDVTRLARIQAVTAFYEQDGDALAEWAMLAASTAPHTPWPSWLDGDHPARRMIDDVAPLGWSGWPDLGVASPRRGGAFLNGRWLDTPVFPVAAPNLVQVFDARGDLVQAWWQHGAAAPDALLLGDRGPKRAPRWYDAGAVADLAG